MIGSGICPICAGRVGITDSGVLGSHGRNTSDPIRPTGEGIVVPCEGAGSLPA